jgi:hypothetical protein
MFGRAVAVVIASRLASEAAFNAAPQYTIVGTPPETSHTTDWRESPMCFMIGRIG